MGFSGYEIVLFDTISHFFVQTFKGLKIEIRALRTNSTFGVKKKFNFRWVLWEKGGIYQKCNDAVFCALFYNILYKISSF